MPAYLCDLVPASSGRGRDPAGRDLASGANWIYFREMDRALLWSDVALSHPQAQLIADAPDDQLSSDTRTSLGVFAKDRTFALGSTLRNALVELLTAPASEKQWGKTLGNKITRSRNIWFGPGGPGKNLLYTEPFVPARSSKSVEDLFTRTGNLAGSTTTDGQTTWTEPQGTLLTCVSTQVQITAPDASLYFCVGRLALAMDTIDQAAEFLIGTYSRVGGDLNLGSVVRGNTLDGAAGDEGYGFEVGIASGGAGLRRVYDFFTDANLGSDATTTTSGAGRLEASGSDVVSKVDGSIVLGPFTDASPYNTFKQVGIAMFSSGGSGNVAGIERFVGEDLAVAPRPSFRSEARRPAPFKPGNAL